MRRVGAWHNFARSAWSGGNSTGWITTRAKSDEVLWDRGFDLAFVSRVFPGFVLEREDTRPYDEVRYQAIGELLDDLYVVVYTRVGKTGRLITAWEAEPEDWVIWNVLR